jgi:hypothetical protein
MDESEDGDETTALPEALRTATPPYIGRPNTEMNLIGWVIFVGIGILLLPILPVLAVYWLVATLRDRITRQRSLTASVVQLHRSSV